jgi:hypothetical protein
MKLTNKTFLMMSLMITLVAGSGCDLFGKDDSNSSGSSDSDSTSAVACDFPDNGYCQEISGAETGLLQQACSDASGTVGGDQCSEHSQDTVLATCAKTSSGISYTEYYSETYLLYSAAPGYCSTVKGLLQSVCEAAGGTFTDVEGRLAAYTCP